MIEENERQRIIIKNAEDKEIVQEQINGVTHLAEPLTERYTPVQADLETTVPIQNQIQYTHYFEINNLIKIKSE